jgi:pimeloyl-ACP methyl ester carboxylesterase
MRLLLPFLTLSLAACSLAPAPTPMTKTFEGQPGAAPARCLVVLLPGAGDLASTFRKEGFIAGIQRSGASVDIVAADATVGYYYRGVVVERIAADVLGPLRGRYEQVWMMGVSMGGFGSLHYAQQHADEVDAVAVFAPYLGSRRLGEEIRSAGGLARWTPDPPAPITKKNYQRQLWSWLHRVTRGAEKGPTLYVGYGDDDRLAPQDALLAAALPQANVFHAQGGHDWPVWRELLQQFLQRSQFTSRCAPRGPPPQPLLP